MEKQLMKQSRLLEEFLKESYNANLRNVRIIHGKGIGVLRQAIGRYLEDHGLVSSFSPTDKNYGGEGAVLYFDS